MNVPKDNNKNPYNTLVMLDKPLIFGISIATIFIALSILVLIHKTPIIYTQRDRLTVICTTSLICDAVNRVGGNHVALHGLMGPGVDPHIYRAREHDLHALMHADIIFYHGLHLEGKMGEILHNLQRYTETVAVTRDVPTEALLQSPEFIQVYDPHIWFDVMLWITVINTIRDALIHKDPLHAQDYAHNAQHYIRELEDLHQYVITKVHTVPPKRRILVSAHDAFAYFGRAYGFTVIGLQGLSTDSEASMRDIQQLVTYIITHKLPAIFIESSLPRRTIEAVQQAVEARNWHITIEPELYSDALGSPGTKAENYIGMVKHNIDAIVDTLKK